ncbi:MAG: redoxin domain-containing protein [Pirellulales bacterium]
MSVLQSDGVLSRTARARRLSELAARYEPKGVQFVGINSNRQDTLREIAHYARVHKIDFPLLKDPYQRVADLFGATRTPTAFLLDARQIIRYRGPIDDQFGVGYARAGATTSDLAAALDELLAGKPVSTPITEPVGCYIGSGTRNAPTGDITYSNQVSRLVETHCVHCHRPGRIAPFSLASYDDVTAWAESMCEVMDEGRMPPWHASPEHGQFSNDAHMPAVDKRLFRQRFENGMPQGDPSELPEPTNYTEGWQIPEPDVVLRCSSVEEIGANVFHNCGTERFYVNRPRLTK